MSKNDNNVNSLLKREIFQTFQRFLVLVGFVLVQFRSAHLSALA